jgi:hypothetical protein
MPELAKAVDDAVVSDGVIERNFVVAALGKKGECSAP